MSAENRELLRNLDRLLGRVEVVNAAGSELPDDLAADLILAGIEGPHRLSALGRCEAIWDLQEPLMRRQPCIRCGRSAALDDDGLCARHRGGRPQKAS